MLQLSELIAIKGGDFIIKFMLENQDLVTDLLLFGLSLISFVVTLIRTNSVKHSVDSFKEVYELRKTVDSSSYSQSFTSEEKDYILNPVTNELEEKPIPKNVQDYINSYIDSCLERAIERFLPNNVQDSDVEADYTERVGDLAALGDAMDLAEEYREKFGLPDNYSMAQIYEAVGKSAEALKVKLGEKVNSSPSPAPSPAPKEDK